MALAASEVQKSPCRMQESWTLPDLPNMNEEAQEQAAVIKAEKAKALGRPDVKAKPINVMY